MATAMTLNYTKCIVRISKEDIVLFEIAESLATGEVIFIFSIIREMIQCTLTV